MNVAKELAVFNRITFVEDSHAYLIDNEPSGAPSVTQLLKRYKKKFEVDKIAARVAKKQGTTTDHIKAEWEMNNLYSTTIGSMLHKYIENFYCNKKVAFDGSFKNLGFEEKKKISENFPKLVEYFQNFYNDNSHLICVRNEFVLGDIDDTRICGMSDMLSYNSQSDALEIIDFKTNKKMEKRSPYGDLFYPFDDMTEGEINEYTIQLNTYKYFIEKYTSLRIDKLKIIWFNVVNSNYEIFELGDIQPKIALMLENFKAASLFQK